MFSDLTKASYTTYLYSSALDLHESAINAYAYSFFYLLHAIFSFFKIIFPRQVYMHVKCIIQGSVDLKQSFNPPICNMYPYVQIRNIFTIRGDLSLINP